MGLEQAVVKRELPGDVTLELRRAVNGPASREEQMLLLAEINDRADVERGAYIGKVGLIRGLMINFRANEHIGQNLLLQHRPDKSPIVVAGKGIDAVATPAVGRPRTPTLLRP